MAYSDRADEFIGAWNELKIPRDLAIAGDPQTNAHVERQVQMVKRGCRVLLESAGLPTSYWPLAMQAYCFMRNCIQEGDDGKTAWQRRHGTTFKPRLLEFGSLVHYKPSKTTKEGKSLGSLGPQTVPGMLLGYEQALDGRWRGGVHCRTSCSVGFAVYAGRRKGPPRGIG